MQRYFGSIIGSSVLLSDDDNHHLLKVMRARKGEQIEVVTDEKMFICEIKEIKPLQIQAISQIKEKRELDNDVILIVALLKGEKMDFVLQKATELGVSEIVLLSTERTIVKTKDYNNSQKLERYGRILKEAAEQSHRLKIPLLYRLIHLDELSKIKADVKMIAYEEAAGSTKSLYHALSKIKKGNKIAVVIGPEGGFSEPEVKMALKQGYEIVSLGSRILRAETASIYALSVISSYLEK